MGQTYLKPLTKKSRKHSELKMMAVEIILMIALMTDKTKILFKKRIILY